MPVAMAPMGQGGVSGSINGEVFPPKQGDSSREQKAVKGTVCSIPNCFFLQNLCLTLPKFNSSPLKSYRNPIGKACLPTIIFQGRTVKLRGGKHFFLGEI